MRRNLDSSSPDIGLNDARFCEGATAALVASQLFDLETPEREPESVSGFVSPDGARLIDVTADALELRRCAFGSPTTLLPLPADLNSHTVQWAPDSRHAMVQAQSESSTEFLLVDVDAPDAVVRWRSALKNANAPAEFPWDNYAYSFSADSEYALIQDGSTFSVVSVADGRESVLPLPPGASSVEWADDGRSLLVRRALGEYSAAWWLVPPLSASPTVFASLAAPIFETEVAGVDLAVSARASVAFVIPVQEPGFIWRIDLRDEAAGPRNVNTSSPTGPFTHVEFAPDGSGAMLNQAGSIAAVLWLALHREGQDELVWLNGAGEGVGFQPWP